MPPRNPYVGKECVAWDTETWLILPGLLAPPMVCLSLATVDGVEGLLGREDGLAWVRRELEGPRVIVCHNAAYDLGVVCAADPSLVPLVFDKLDRDGEAFDTMIAEQLIRIHAGTLGQGSSSSGSGGLSLEDLGRQYCGVDRSAEKHGPDSYRLRYGELDGIPFDQWPEAARAYPIRDARVTYDVAALQIQDGRNLHDLPAQIRAHWVLHLSACYGIRTDAHFVADFVAKVTKEHEESRARFLRAGLLKVRTCKLKDDPDHEGQKIRETPDEIDVDAFEVALSDAQEAAKTAPADKVVGKRWKELQAGWKALQLGKACRYSTDTKALKAAVSRAYQGEPPRAAKGDVKTDKDTLWESSDKLLDTFADAQDNEKFFSTYLRVLKQGTEFPINARITILVDTGRCSYSKPNLQNLPRGCEAGKPREAFVSRPGKVFASLDYPTLELRTLAYLLEYLGLESEMAKALRPGPNGEEPQDLHARLGAQIKGCTYAEFMAALKAGEQWAADFRQMSKAANFGLPGGLGAVKLVSYARKSYDARFCLLSGNATECGVTKHFDKRSKTIVCKECLDIAYALKDTWFDAWPEMETYFEIVKEWTAHEKILVEKDDGNVEEMDVGSVTQIISERVRGRCSFTNGANTGFQGLAADIAKRSLWLAGREAYAKPTSALWDSRLAVFIHDEQFLELYTGTAPEAAERACRLMEQAFAEFCGPDAPHSRERGLLGIPCKVEPALSFRWYKGADTVRDAAGRVVPMEVCPDCSKVQPVGWDSVAMAHKRKRKGAPAEPCPGVGKVNQTVAARLSERALP